MGGSCSLLCPFETTKQILTNFNTFKTSSHVYLKYYKMHCISRIMIPLCQKIWIFDRFTWLHLKFERVHYCM
jgi:hypothetical protein